MKIIRNDVMKTDNFPTKKLKQTHQRGRMHVQLVSKLVEGYDFHNTQ